MGLNRSNADEMAEIMMRVKIGTLMHYLPKEEVEQYVGCDFEFYAKGDNYIPIDLHVWLGKNHNYREKFHKVFPVPEHLRIPLINSENVA